MARRIWRMMKKHHLPRPMAKRKAKARKTIRIGMVQKIQRRKRLTHAMIVRKRVTLKRTAGRNIQTRFQRSSRRRRAPRLKKRERQLKKKKTLLTFIDIDNKEDDVDYELHNNAGAFKFSCNDIHDAFIKAPTVEDNDVTKALVTIKLGLEEDDIEDSDTPSDVSQIRPTLQALSSPNIWIGDTGATKHLTKYKQGGINPWPSTSRTREMYSQAIKPAMEVDIPGRYCDKNGNEQFTVKLQNVDVILESHYNLMSITRLIEEGHKLSGNKKEGLTLKKNRQVIAFDIRVKMPKGVFWCANIMRNDSSNSKVVAGSSDNQIVAKPIATKKVLQPVLKMHIGGAHAILGHANEDATQKMAAALSMMITCGGLKTCKLCAIAKAKQMNVNSKSKGKKAQVFNRQMFHDIAIVKEDGNGKKLCQKSVWHICVDKFVGFKCSKFFVYKSKILEYLCELMQRKMKQGYPIQIIQQDYAGENKRLINMAYSMEWKLRLHSRIRRTRLHSRIPRQKWDLL
jgi:hypothetical protein